MDVFLIRSIFFFFFRDISVLVDPNKCKSKFNLMYFIRDLLGAETIKKELADAESSQGYAVKVSVSYPECAKNKVQQSDSDSSTGMLLLSFKTALKLIFVFFFNKMCHICLSKYEWANGVGVKLPTYRWFFCQIEITLHF